MKTKIFSTNKADILVVELPEGCNAPNFLAAKIALIISDENGENLQFPEGNWQPLIFDEITAEKIVDFKHIESDHPCEQCGFNVECYRNYLEQSEDDWGKHPVADRCHTALESLQSLIETNVQKENPYQDDWDELCTWGHGGFAKDGKTELELYSEAEKSVFRNPYYFYKLK